ncbi:serine/threonine-protein kinase [Marinicella litoralis]|uniref:serine/threonine-protein kinase n=1 Tax=Marinicella litoralis TaxID=644220 RepID=UPI00105E5C73|nr:serine/threonine-protein kinase [Marinicella litoralis]
MKKPEETKTLLNQALGLNTQERTVLLEQINDRELKSQVETLLADEAQCEAFLKQQQTSTTVGTDQAEAISPGALINRIRIIKLLGQGGMGSVYLGFDEKLERQVAVKSIRPEHLKNPSTQQRFVREAQILSKINHPSICQLYDYLETPEGDFLVLEYIKGKPLYQTPLTEQQKLLAMGDLAAALAVAHEHGIVHRDLKPDNIMISAAGQLKVLDFGIAQSLSQPSTSQKEAATEVSSGLTQQGSLVGTIRYMSPEQAQGKNIDTASDLYALGIIAQEVFSHQAAYQVMETDQLLTDVQQGKRVAPSGLAEPLTQLIDELTQLNPQQRPTAAATAEKFNAIINAPKLKRKKTLITATLLAALVLLCLLWWQWMHMDEQAQRNETVKKYENQINELVKQAEQIYVLPIHPVDEEINSVVQQGDQLYKTVLQDQLLTETEKSRLLGIILLRGEYYQDAIPMLIAGQAESPLLADAWTMLFIEKATEYSEQHGLEQTMNDADFKAQYLNPALAYIEKSQLEAGQADPLFQAFVLSQTESLEAGLTAVNQLLSTASWNKKAVNLKALILSALMTRARENGEWELAKQYALMTAATYQLSNQMARSFPPTYADLCRVSLDLMTDGIHRSGTQVEDFAAQSIMACENALKVQPNNNYPKQLLSRIYLMKAQWEVDYGIDANPSLARAKHWNQQASTLENLFSGSWTQALILAMQAKQLILTGAPAQPVIEQSLELFNNLLKLDTEYQPYVVSDMLYVLAQYAHEKTRQNTDPSDTIQQAQTLFDQTMLLPGLMVSEQWGLVNNMAQVYWVQLRHQFEQGHNIMPMAEKLLAFLNPAENRLNNDPNQIINLANTHLLMAEYQRRNQQTTHNHLELAADYIAQALAINTTDYHIMLSQASLLTLQAYDTDQDYSKANASFQQAIEANPNNPYSLQAWANGLIIQAQNSQTATQQQAAIQLAHAKITQALLLDEQQASFHHTHNEVQQMAAAIGLDLTLE